MKLYLVCMFLSQILDRAFIYAEPQCDVCQDPNRSYVSFQTCVEANTTDTASLLVGELYERIRQEECKLDDPSQHPDQYCPSDYEEFDFIVVGAGVAGCVLANRLTEESWTVLLLEAGGNPTKTNEIPGIYLTSILTNTSWQYHTEPEETNCLGSVDGRCIFPTGRVLGGTSAMHGFSYLRGSPKVYDSWAANGNTGWDYHSCLGYFKKSEDWKPSYPPKTSSDNHGVGGYLSVEDFTNENEEVIIEALKIGAVETGYRVNHDFNGDSLMGIGRVQGTKLNKTRCSSAKAFLNPIKGRDNLKLAKHSFVTKILIDESKRASGVEFLDLNGKTTQVFAKKEVIACAGVVNSPKLLMLSGVGPKDHLEELSITVVQDLPVGKHLVDHAAHLGVGISFNYSRSTRSLTDLMYEYLTTLNSPLANIGIFNWIHSINTKDKNSEQPDIYFLLYYTDKGDFATVAENVKVLNFNEDISQQFHEILENRLLVLILPVLIYPESKGKVRLDSKDPMSPPKIFPGYLTRHEDIETLLKAVEYLHELSLTSKFKALDAIFEEITPKPCQIYPKGSRDCRICAMKHMVTTSFSPVGTCKMGSQTDPTSVVDPCLKVIGIDRLRVIDASAMPSTPTFSTQATTYMMAEKGADLIKQCYGD